MQSEHSLKPPATSGKKTLIGMLTLASVMSIVIGAVAMSGKQKTAPLLQVENNPQAMGVINKKGEWIIAPLYDEVVYVKLIGAFWVKGGPTSILPYFWPPTLLNSIGKNHNWKLLDHDGHEIRSELAEFSEPLRDWPPVQALGVTAYDDHIALNTRDGLCLADAHGHALSANNYNSMQYVGDSLWVARPRHDEKRTTTEQVFPTAVLGDPSAMPPAPVLLNNDGHKIATLPKGLYGPDGYFVNGILVCNSMVGPEAYVLKNGYLAYPYGTRQPKYMKTRYLREGQPRPFECFYNLPVSADAPIKFIDMAKKTKLPSEVIPIAVADNLALVSTQDDMYGLVDRRGNWVMKPDYNRLAYCDPDRLVCSKGTITIAQAKARKEQVGRPDIR